MAPAIYTAILFSTAVLPLATRQIMAPSAVLYTAAVLFYTAVLSVRAINISTTTQLFADDFLIANLSSSIVRHMNAPDASRVVIRPDAPWERGFAIGIIGTSVLEDGGAIKMWYTLRNRTLRRPDPSIPPQPDYHHTPILTAYAESHDGGVTFVKPLLHRYAVNGSNGSTANNIIGVMKESATNAVFIDPTQPASRRFRAVAGFSHAVRAERLTYG